MSQNIIDTGQAANDGTGEPLRQAFTAINNNFSQIWTSGPVNSNIQIANNQIATLQTNQALILAPNGIGNVQANAAVIPGIDSVYDLGASDRRWDTVWTQYFDISGPATFNDVTVDGNLTVQGNIIQIGNIVTDSKTIQLANTAASSSAANGSGITVGANDDIATMLYSSTSNTWTMNIGANITGNVTAPYFIGNGSLLTGVSNYANANAVAYGQSGWAGNIIPAGNAVYSLGNSTNQWSDLYVSNATIYINNVPIGLTAGNVLTVAGADVVTTGANGVTNIGNIGFDGNNIYNTQGAGQGILISSNKGGGLDGEIYLPYKEETANLTITNYGANINLAIQGSHEWVFDTTGNIVLPGDTSSINYANGQPYGGSSIPVEPTANGYFSTLPDFLQFVGGTLIRTGQTSDGVFFDSNAGDGNISYPVRTNFSIGGTTPVVVTVDVVVNDECSDFGLCVFENNGIQPQWAWDPNSTRIAAQYDCTQPVIYTLDDSAYSGYNIPSPGTYRVRFTYDPTNAPNIILETLDTSNVVLDTLTMGGTLNTSNDYYIGFSADQDNTSLRTYIQNLTIAVGGGSTYTDSLQLASGGNANTGNITFDAANISTNLADTDIQIIANGTGNVNISVADGNVWRFGNDGYLHTPSDTAYIDSGYETGNTGFATAYGQPLASTQYYNSGNLASQIILNRLDVPTVGTHNIQILLFEDNANSPLSWTFDKDGNLILPDIANVSINYANGSPYGVGGSGSFSSITMTSTPTGAANNIQYGLGNLVVWNDSGWVIGEYDASTDTYGNTGIRINPGIEGPADIILPSDAANNPVQVNNYEGGVVVSANMSLQLSAGANTWILNPDASIQFPQINTPRGDNPSGSIYGYTLVIGDGENEAVITTPNGVEGIDDSQRLVINPGKGRDGTSGEGGDIYLWAGRGGSGDAPNAISGGSGGDIKIRGGQGGGGIDATGDGGYIRIEAGDSSALGGSAGYIEISGGVSQDLTGGYVNISGGQGVTGADANLTGGVGTAGSGGAVRLTGGTSANGLPEYGNIYVQSGINTWVFDNTGNLIINHGSQITEVASPVPGNYALALSGTGVIDPDQQLLIYPTSLDANHLHLTSGNLYNTELFLGNDNLYVKLANTGDVVINTDDLVGNTAQWTFGTDGVLSAAGNISASNFVGSGSNVELVAGSSTWTFDNTGNLTVPGNMIINGNINVFGSDTALIQPTDNVPLALISSGSNAGTTTFWVENINDPANSAIAGMYAPLQGTANVRIITGNNATTVNFWDFDNTGNLTAPGNVVANTFVSNAFNVVTAGSLFISSQYGLGTVGTILEQDGLLELVANGTGGCVLVGWDSTYGNGIGNVAQIYFNRVGGGEGNAILTTGNAAGTSYEWNFDNTGNLTIPGTMIVAGGIVGSGASPAPTLSGFDSLSAISITATGTGTVINAASGNITTNEVTGTRFNFLNGSYTATLTGSGATANYSLNLPANAGSNGQVLTTDGSGNLSWTTAAGGSYGNANVADFLAAFGSNVVSTTGNVLASYFIATDSGNVLSLTTRSGDSNNSNANPQIIMGYAGTADYPSFIHTTHNAGTPVDNTIEFWTSDGTQAGTFPANAVLGLTVTNGNIETGGILTNNYYYANGTPVSFGGSSYGNANVADFLDSLGSNAIITTGNITGGNVSATANVIGNGYARFSGTFDESQASTAGLYLGYAGGTPRMMFGTGNTSQTLEIDNDGGTLRFYKPGTTLASLTNTGDFSVTGNISGNTGGFAIGYRDIPQVTFSANATAALTDAGKHFYSTTSGNLALTLPDNSNVAYPTGATLTVVVNAAGNVLVNQGVGVTLYQAGSSTTGNRVVGAYGMATVMKVATNTWVINGTGVY